MKKYDAGISEKKMYGGETIAKSSNKRIIRPRISLNVEQFPPLKGKEFDDHFTIEADVRISELRSDKTDTRKEIRYELEIIKLGMKGDKISDKEFESLSDKEQEAYLEKNAK